MKIKLPNDLIVIDILSILLVLAISFIPQSVVRTVLGLPFLIIFPGYVLVAVAFPRHENMDHIERFALSVGMSITCTALIGLGLNYSPWGIRMLPVLYSIFAFIMIPDFCLIEGERRMHAKPQKLISISKMQIKSGNS